jgi:hypothetical protein
MTAMSPHGIHTQIIPARSWNPLQLAETEHFHDGVERLREKGIVRSPAGGSKKGPAGNPKICGWLFNGVTKGKIA